MTQYTCPMHPEVQRSGPGMCPECGMSLVPTQDKKTHDKHEGHSTQMFLKKFWVSLILTIPVVLYADVTEMILGISPPAFPGSAYMPLILGSIVFFYGGWVFLIGAKQELQARLPGMMTLIALAICAAYLWSIYAVFTGQEPLFWEVTTLISIMLLGHFFEMRATRKAKGALRQLSSLLPDTAEVIRNGEAIIVSLSELASKDTVRVKPGGSIPADGIVTSGESDVNESMITGESRPVLKKKGASVVAGTTNGDGTLDIEVTHIGDDTFLAGVMRLVEEAEGSKSRLQLLSDKAAFYLTVIAVVAGIVTLIAWLSLGFAINIAVARLVAVLVVACPHALGLAVPLVASISTTKAAQAGFIVKQRLALEAARNVDVVLFDKTGTLTKGEFGVMNVSSTKGHTEEYVLSIAASLESLSEHPLARAIVDHAKKQGVSFSQPEAFKALRGKGITANLNGKHTYVGGPSLLEDMNIDARGVRSKQTTIFVIQDNTLIGSISLTDIIRKESYEAISLLSDMGIETAMITGDADDVARHVSKELGIDTYFARVLPDKKAHKVQEMQEKGKRVAMVGDGINDAPALAQADVGIAIGAGTNVAIESAGIILVRNNPKDIARLIRLSRMTYTKMIQNLFWATGYNVVALPLAAGALAFRGITLEPAAAAILMSASTVIVAVNAMVFRKAKL